MRFLLALLMLLMSLNQSVAQESAASISNLQETDTPDHVRATALAWRPDGERLAVGTNTGLLLLDAQFDRVASLDTGWVYGLAWSHDSRNLAISSERDDECALAIWQTETDEVVWSATSCHSSSLSWSQNDDWLAFIDNLTWRSSNEAFASQTQNWQLHVIRPGTPESQFLVETGVSSYEWHPERDWLVFAAEDETIHVYDVPLRTAIWKEAHAVQNVTWSPDGDRLAAVISAGSKTLYLVNEAGPYSMTWPRWHGIHVWNMRNNTLENTLEITDNATRLGRLHWLADGRIGSYYDRIRNEVLVADAVEAWDLNTGRHASYRLGGGSSSGGNVLWSPDRTKVAAETLWQGCKTNIFQIVPPVSQESPRISGCAAAWTPDSRYVTTVIEQGLQQYDVQIGTAEEYPLPIHKASKRESHGRASFKQ